MKFVIQEDTKQIIANYCLNTLKEKFFLPKDNTSFSNRLISTLSFTNDYLHLLTTKDAEAFGHEIGIAIYYSLKDKIKIPLKDSKEDSFFHNPFQWLQSKSIEDIFSIINLRPNIINTRYYITMRYIIANEKNTNYTDAAIKHFLTTNISSLKQDRESFIQKEKNVIYTHFPHIKFIAPEYLATFEKFNIYDRIKFFEESEKKILNTNESNIQKTPNLRVNNIHTHTLSL